MVECPLLAQSGHGVLRCTCPLLGLKRTLLPVHRHLLWPLRRATYCLTISLSERRVVHLSARNRRRRATHPLRLLMFLHFLKQCWPRFPDDLRVRTVSAKTRQVLPGGRRVIERIMLQSQARKDRPWLWMITARARLASLSDSGYAASREQAFADFKARWEFK